MSDSIKSIDTEEANRVMRAITQESGKAREAVQNVMKSPDQLVHWQGNRRRQFDSQVAADMQKLQNAIIMIDDAANKIREAINSFTNAD
jgi:uncharacterized protein YukE